jgi:hypothetical protein
MVLKWPFMPETLSWTKVVRCGLYPKLTPGMGYAESSFAHPFQ